MIAALRGLRMGALERRLLWIFGSPRSGSTWLLNVLAADQGVAAIDEPGIGAHLGLTIAGLGGLEPRSPQSYRLLDLRCDSPHYFFSRQHEQFWRPELRRLLLRRLGAGAKHARLVAIKEPNGSEAADLILSTLPRSRLIFLVRDPRDVLDSELDAFQPGAWGTRLAPGFEAPDRLTFLRRRAHMWRCRTLVVRRAYDAHPPALRRIVRYEELRADPAAVVAALARWLGLDPERLSEQAQLTAFERVAASERGPGRFLRAAKPGLWRESLSAPEQAAINDIVGPCLAALGYGEPPEASPGAAQSADQASARPAGEGEGQPQS